MSNQIQHSQHTQFEAWDDAAHRASYYQLQQLFREFKEQGAQGYSVFGQLGALNSSTFSWHIVPYFSNDSARLKQFHCLWEMLSTSPEEGVRVSFDSLAEVPNIAFLNARGEDPFCDPVSVNAQRIAEGKLVELLINYAPVNIYWEKESLDFLIIPKAHRVTCEELHVEEYVEAMHLAKTVFERFKSAGLANSGVLYHKSGKKAGQSVFHWHAHLMLMKEPPVHEWEKVSIILSTMTRQKLPAEKLKSLISHCQEVLKYDGAVQPIKKPILTSQTLCLSFALLFIGVVLLYPRARGK